MSSEIAFVERNGKLVERLVEFSCARLYRQIGSKRTFLLLGNSIQNDDTIWCADWRTGKRFDVLNYLLRSLPDDQQVPTEEVEARMTQWARKGDADAAWWLGWWHDGTNHPKSVWFYMAAMRKDPKAFGWALERVYSDAKYAGTCEGVPAPDLDFLREIQEFDGAKEWGDWREAIAKSVVAVHIPAAPEQSDPPESDHHEADESHEPGDCGLPF